MIPYEADDGSEWTVSAIEYRPMVRGNRRGSPDTWEPDDPGEIGELVARRTGTAEELSEDEMVVRFGQETVDRLREAVGVQLAENNDDDGPDYEPDDFEDRRCR